MTTALLAPRPRYSLFRQTFLRGHVGPELTTTAEVLAVKFLAGDLERALRRSLTADERSLLIDDFFGRAEPERQLYLPLALAPHMADKPILPRDYLTSLSDYLARPPLGAPGVLLAARSGAGKTVAGIKAYRDCLVWPRDRYQPLLAGRLPVRLAVSGKAAETPTLSELRSHADTNPDDARKRARQVDSPVLVEELLRKAANLNMNPPAVGETDKMLRQWLQYGPPLLLFIDLNAADNDIIRLALACSLRCFQETYAPLGHRCIVTYRSTEARDDAMSALRERDQFRIFDLAPIDAANAVKYLQHLRLFESDAYRHFGLTAPQRDVSRECSTLEEFVQRYAASRESLISTPLIMELVALLRPGDVEAIHSLANLYEQVTTALLERQGLTSEEDQDRAITAMVRLALSIVALGPTATRLDGRRRLLDLLEHPEYGNRGKQRWHPSDAFWLGAPGSYCPYYSGAIRAAERYRERALFAARGESLGFLHDSFVYYFAAYALRYHDGRHRPPADVGVDSDAWSHQTVARILPHLASWEQPLEFLGGMLHIEEVRKLTVPLLTAEPQPEMARVLRRLLRGRQFLAQQEDDPVLRHLERAVRARLAEVQRYPEALFPQVYNHLSWCETPQAMCHVFAHGILRPAMNRTGRPWLRAETPMPPLREEVFRCDSEVQCLAFSTPGEFVTGHLDGSVRRWHTDSGSCTTLYRHEDIGVAAVLVDERDSSVLSGGWDQTVRRLRPGTAEPEILYRHKSGVAALAINTHDMSVVLGGEDGEVCRVRSGAVDAEVLYRHRGAICAIAVDNRDGTVLSGGEDGEVRRFHPMAATPEVLYHDPNGKIRAVAVDSRDGAVLWGVSCGVHCLRAGSTEASVLYSHKDTVTAIAVSVRDGSVVSGGMDGEVRRLWQGMAKADLLYRHEHKESESLSLAIDIRDGSVISGGWDKAIRRTGPAAWDEAEVLSSQEHEYEASKVLAVAVDRRDGSVLFGDDDDQVCRLRSGEDEPDILYRHRHWVTSIGVDTLDGTVVSGGRDNKVRHLRPDAVEADILYEHVNWYAGAVVVDILNGTVLSGGEDGKVRRIQLGKDEHEVLYTKENAMITSVAVDALTRSAVWGEMNGAVCHLRPGQEQPVVLYRHEGEAHTVAVDRQEGSIISGGKDRAVRRLRSEHELPEILYSHDDQVRALAIDSVEGVLVSGGDDANLHLLRLAHGDFLMLLTPCPICSVACSLRHNRIAMALSDGRLVLVCVEPSAEALLRSRAAP